MNLWVPKDVGKEPVRKWVTSLVSSAENLMHLIYRFSSLSLNSSSLFRIGNLEPLSNVDVTAMIFENLCC